mmetsp:Transcript_13543/g.21117  ORF Transcript_13543/g.21117 Transcript_13543/m.21117 type:complete len:113 (-) Transcript_13543:11501-11839(-)
MKSTRESPLLVNTALMFPLVYGVPSSQTLEDYPSLEIRAPAEKSPYHKQLLGLETSLVYKVHEIEGVKDLTREKCALFVPASKQDDAKDEEAFKKVEKAVGDLRQQLSNHLK